MVKMRQTARPGMGGTIVLAAYAVALVHGGAAGARLAVRATESAQQRWHGR